MDILDALILGIIQALTEFLPVSSSGHIELGKAFLDVKNADDPAFTIIVHAATTLSIILVYRQDIFQIIQDLLKFEWNESTQFICKIFISMIPVGIVGLFFKDHVDILFQGNVAFVGWMLIITGLILAVTVRLKDGDGSITFGNSLIIGLAQAVAVLPGISRSGSTIVTALLLGVSPTKAARFSFLMVILPILGITLLEVGDLVSGKEQQTIGMLPLLTGFIGSFVVGVFACKWMIKFVREGKLIYFAVYCFVVGIIALVIG